MAFEKLCNSNKYDLEHFLFPLDYNYALYGYNISINTHIVYFYGNVSAFKFMIIDILDKGWENIMKRFVT